MTSATLHTTVEPTKPAFPYVGGKKRLAARLIGMIEAIPHTTYAEPFIGGGGVFLRRRLKPRAEVINDLSGDLAGFYRILQRHYVAFMDMLRYQITTRAEFDRLKQVDPETLTDLERAARFLFLQVTTYGGLRHGVFGVRPHLSGRMDVNRLQPLLEDLHARLSGVTIERLPFQDLIRRYDRPETLFFIDPPYWGVEGLYGKELFSRADYEVLRERLRQLRGRFILTLNDLPAVRDYFGEFDVEPVELRYSVSHKVGKELIITGGGA